MLARIPAQAMAAPGPSCGDGPGTRDRAAALLARLPQNMFDKSEVRLNAVVDDPIMAAAGTLQQ